MIVARYDLLVLYLHCSVVSEARLVQLFVLCSWMI
jgi:hypothetical protein